MGQEKAGNDAGKGLTFESISFDKPGGAQNGKRDNLLLKKRSLTLPREGMYSRRKGSPCVRSWKRARWERRYDHIRCWGRKAKSSAVPGEMGATRKAMIPARGFGEAVPTGTGLVWRGVQKAKPTP